MIAAAVLILGAGVLFGLQRLGDVVQSAGITHRVDAALEPADYIEATPGALKGYNVLIITTDTTRADHIGCYGNRSVETPVIDDLARGGILCAQAVTPSPSTLPAHSSLLTGLYPVHHGARSNGTFKLDKKVTTLAERLGALGYRTGAVISAFVLDSRFGLDQGFESYNDDLTKGMTYSEHMFRERAAELTNEPATEWLRENADQPFFLWVHYFDPHAVYLPPEPFRSEYAYDLYDGEIAYADSQIGALLNQLEELGVRDRTLVVYASDHGEGMGEHGEETHSLLIYDATLHVPLIIHAPQALPQGKVIERQCCLIDVVPTVLELLGEEVPAELDGVSLCESPAEENRSILIETIATMTTHGWAPLLGVRRADYKYIFAPTPELYDLAEDPRELHNIHDQTPEIVGQLSTELAGWVGQDPYLATRKAVDISKLQTDKESMRHLAALGYVSTTSGDVDDSVPFDDPKEMIDHWETVQKAINLRAQGDPQAAVTILEAAVAEVPGDVFARSVLGGTYRQLGEYERAMAQLQRAAEDSPNDSTIHLGISGTFIAQGKFAEAEEELHKAIEIEPESGNARIALGQLAMVRGQREKALELYRKAIELDPGSCGAEAYNSIGRVHLFSGELDEARDAFRNAIEIEAFNGDARDGLANILMLEGRVDEAVLELQITLKYDPNQHHALATLASIVSQEGDQEQALELGERALKVSPKYAVAHNNVGLIYRRQGELDQAEEHYLKAIEFDPTLDAAHVNLAQLYMRQDKKDEALEHFKLAVSANPYHPNAIALVNLGVDHFNRGEVKQALGLYRLALRSNPDYALAHRYVASIYAMPQYDRPDLTAHHLRRSLELDPNQSDVDQVKALLQRAEEEIARRQSATPPTAPAEAAVDSDAQPSSSRSPAEKAPASDKPAADAPAPDKPAPDTPAPEAAGSSR